MARDDVIGAIGWFRPSGRVDEALEMAARLEHWWYVSGETSAGRATFAELLSMPEINGSAWRVRALWTAGELAFRAGANDEARRLYDEALRAARAVGDWDSERRALVGLARAALRDGDYARVRELGERGANSTHRSLVRWSRGAVERAKTVLLAS